MLYELPDKFWKGKGKEGRRGVKFSKTWEKSSVILLLLWKSKESWKHNEKGIWIEITKDIVKNGESSFVFQVMDMVLSLLLISRTDLRVASWSKTWRAEESQGPWLEPAYPLQLSTPPSSHTKIGPGDMRTTYENWSKNNKFQPSVLSTETIGIKG